MGPPQRIAGPASTASGQDPPRLRRRERNSLVKNRMREIRTSGSVRGGDGNIPTYSALLTIWADLFPCSGPKLRDANDMSLSRQKQHPCAIVCFKHHQAGGNGGGCRGMAEEPWPGAIRGGIPRERRRCRGLAHAD